MTLTVTPNSALDVTYVVPRLVPGGVHGVHSVTTRPRLVDPRRYLGPGRLAVQPEVTRLRVLDSGRRSGDRDS